MKIVLDTFRNLTVATQIFLVFAVIVIILIIVKDPAKGVGLIAVLGAIKALWPTNHN